MWPNNMDSASSSGMATQFTGMKGRLARTLPKWMDRATSSFPVPLSPVISTFTPPKFCTCRISWRILLMVRLWPMNPATPSAPLAVGNRGKRFVSRVQGLLGLLAAVDFAEQALVRRRQLGRASFQGIVLLDQFAREPADFQMSPTRLSTSSYSKGLTM